MGVHQRQSVRHHRCATAAFPVSAARAYVSRQPRRAVDEADRTSAATRAPRPQPSWTATPAAARCCCSPQGASARTCSRRTTRSRRTGRSWRSTWRRTRLVRGGAQHGAAEGRRGATWRRFSLVQTWAGAELAVHRQTFVRTLHFKRAGETTGPTEFPVYAPDTRRFYETLSARVNAYFDRTGYDPKAPITGELFECVKVLGVRNESTRVRLAWGAARVRVDCRCSRLRVPTRERAGRRWDVRLHDHNALVTGKLARSGTWRRGTGGRPAA